MSIRLLVLFVGLHVVFCMRQPDQYTLFEAHDNGEVVADMVRQFPKTGLRRMIHCLHCFSGRVDRFQEVCFEKGYLSLSFDIERGIVQDMSQEFGFQLALWQILCIVFGGLLVLGPPCSLFVFLSSGTHRRNIDAPLGDTDLWVVRKANCIANNVAVLVDIALQRGVEVLVEQPSSTCMYRLPLWEALFIKYDNKNKMHRVLSWMGAFGHNMRKPSHFRTTLSPDLLEYCLDRASGSRLLMSSCVLCGI